MHVKLALADHLRLNTPLPWDVLNEQGILLLSKGTIVSDPHQLEMLIERGAYVDQDAYRAHKEKEELRKRISNPLEQWDDLHLALGTLLRRRQNEPAFLEKLRGFAIDLEALVGKDVDVALFVMTRMDKTNYGIAHALQVAMTCEIYGRVGDWEVAARRTLVNAALTMNLAMLDLQRVLAYQDGPPSEAQREQIKEHPLRAREQLETLGVTDATWLRIVAEHHESRDGKGYPLGVTDLLPEAEVLNVADRYCALMSHRRQRAAMPANRAARELYLMTSGTMQDIIARMIKAFGLFPPGNLVRLANGEIAMVLRRSEQANKPLVATLIGTRGSKLIDPIQRNTAQTEFAVTALVPESDLALQIDPVKLFGFNTKNS